MQANPCNISMKWISNFQAHRSIYTFILPDATAVPRLVEVEASSWKLGYTWLPKESAGLLPLPGRWLIHRNLLIFGLVIQQLLTWFNLGGILVAWNDPCAISTLGSGGHHISHGFLSGWLDPKECHQSTFLAFQVTPGATDGIFLAFSFHHMANAFAAILHSLQCAHGKQLELALGHLLFGQNTWKFLGKLQVTDNVCNKTQNGSFRNRHAMIQCIHIQLASGKRPRYPSKWPFKASCASAFKVSFWKYLDRSGSSWCCSDSVNATGGGLSWLFSFCKSS